MCESAVGAGIEDKTIAELRALSLESPTYWKPDLELQNETI